MTNKKKAKDILATYDMQIRKDMEFWIKYRPSKWVGFLPGNFTKPLHKFIKTKGVKKFVLILALLLSLIFVGVIPTLNFIWTNIFRLWLGFIFIPLVYWTFAITVVYARVIIKSFCRFLRVFFDVLIHR